jgi:NAD(P)-dependent dehydrogenase (short-subunit alcohol dehydrogenase family)
MLEDSPSLNAAALKPLAADLGNFSDVQRAAREFIAAEDRLDILVNNAAVLPCPVTFDAHGLSVPFGINYLGPFLFTIELVPLLAATAGCDPATDVRVINVGSTAHLDVPAGVQFGSIDDFNNLFGNKGDFTSQYHHYGYTKREYQLILSMPMSTLCIFSPLLLLLRHLAYSLPLKTIFRGPPINFSPKKLKSSLWILLTSIKLPVASLLFTKELQRRFDTQGARVLVLAPHPGAIVSDGAVKNLGSIESKLLAKVLSPSDGALTPLFAAAHPEPAQDRAKYAGAFLLPFGGWREASEQARDPKLAAQLWEASVALLKSILD